MTPSRRIYRPTRSDDHRLHRFRVKVDPGVELTRAAEALVPRDPIRELTGDPPPGRSALDKLRAKQAKEATKI